MKTNRHPGDYQRNHRIVPHLEPLCSDCGGFVLGSPWDNLPRCVDCGGIDVTMVMENDAAEFRATLRAGRAGAMYYCESCEEEVPAVKVHRIKDLVHDTYDGGCACNCGPVVTLPIGRDQDWRDEQATRESNRPL